MDLRWRVSRDREAGLEPAHCPQRPSAAAVVKKQREDKVPGARWAQPRCLVWWDSDREAMLGGAGQCPSCSPVWGRGRCEWVKALPLGVDGLLCVLWELGTCWQPLLSHLLTLESGLRNGLSSAMRPVWGCAGLCCSRVLGIYSSWGEFLGLAC